MDIDEEEAVWDVVRDRINVDIESGEFTALSKTNSSNFSSTASTSFNTLEFDEQSASSSQKPKKGRQVGRKQVGVNATLDSLLGQANLEHARGRTKQAMSYLFEAIRIAPYHVQTYKEIADIFAEQNQPEKSFEFKLLAALLTDKTTAVEWDDIAELSRSFNRLELAIACLAKAIKKDQGNWLYYEKRIQILDSIGDIELAMKTRLQAAQSINCQNSQINFAWIDNLIKTAADYFCTLKDEEKATEALETFILRSREFGRSIDFEHLALLGMWMNNERFEDSAKSILALHQNLIQAIGEDNSPAIDIKITNAGYMLEPFPPVGNIRWRIDPALSNIFITHLIICFIHLNLFHFNSDLIDLLLERPFGQNEDNAYLEIARSLHAVEQVGMAVGFIDKLWNKKPEFKENADAWFLFGYFQQLLDNFEDAKNAYEKVIILQPGHIDACINLSTILQQMGQSDLALETLKDLNLDSCSQLPEERLLIRQAEVLLAQNKTLQYITTLRLLLVPHFYDVHLSGDELIRKGRRKTVKILHMSLTRCAMDTIRGSPLERMVKRLGAIAIANHRPMDNLGPHELHDYAFKLAETLYLAGEYEEMLCVVCYAFVQPKIASLNSKMFTSLLFFASIKARDYTLAFDFLRFYMTFTLPRITKGRESTESASAQALLPQSHLPTENLNYVYAAMNFILCQHQSVNYHRFIMRQLVKLPDCDSLHIISGNNSMVTGSYRHALGEYFMVWLKHQDNPLLAFLIALAFAHISCKKDISSRHVVGLRALAFMSKYSNLRSPFLSQEIEYNMGRLFHQMGILSNAIRCYERVLYECPTPMILTEGPHGERREELAMKYDLRRQASYNLSLIYESAGNRIMARHILEEFCTI